MNTQRLPKLIQTVVFASWTTAALASQTESPTATLEVRHELDRRESVQLLTAGPCERRLFGNWTQETTATPILRGPSAENRQIKVQADAPITLAYSFYISDKSCTVAATAFLQEGKTYLVGGGRKFDGAVLAVSTGCTLQLVESESQQPVPLLPAFVQPGFTKCMPQK